MSKINKLVLRVVAMLSSLTLWYVLVLWSMEPTAITYGDIISKVYRNVFLYIVPTASQILVILILLWHLWTSRGEES